MAVVSSGPPKPPRDERGRFARIVEHMGAVTVMESRTTMPGADGEFADGAPGDAYTRIAGQ